MQHPAGVGGGGTKTQPTQSIQRTTAVLSWLTCLPNSSLLVAIGAIFCCVLCPRCWTGNSLARFACLNRGAGFPECWKQQSGAGGPVPGTGRRQRGRSTRPRSVICRPCSCLGSSEKLVSETPDVAETRIDAILTLQGWNQHLPPSPPPSKPLLSHFFFFLLPFSPEDSTHTLIDYFNCWTTGH